MSETTLDSVTTADATALDEGRAEAFAERLFGLYTGGMLTYMVDIGHRTGLFTAAAAGPATSDELAARAGLQERYVREWLGAVVTGGIIEYDADTATYHLPAEHAVALTGDGFANVAPMAQVNTLLAKHLHSVARAFREGGGVPYSQFRPELTDVMDAASRNMFDGLLLDGYLPLVPGLIASLQAGARVADVGCGTGHAVVVMARAYPMSTFVGYDIAEDAIAQGRAEAAEEGLANAHFVVADAARLSADEPFDAVFSFDAIHDQVDPAGVLERIHTSLVSGGVYTMVEPHVSSNLEDNVANPFAPWVYSVSTLHCMTVSLANGGVGLGTAWGEQRALHMLADAGFDDITVQPSPGDPLEAVYMSHKRTP